MYNIDIEETYKAKQRTRWDRKSEVIKMKTRAINLQGIIQYKGYGHYGYTEDTFIRGIFKELV